jgi:hypothetical protein
MHCCLMCIMNPSKADPGPTRPSTDEVSAVTPDPEDEKLLEDSESESEESSESHPFEQIRLAYNADLSERVAIAARIKMAGFNEGKDCQNPSPAATPGRTATSSIYHLNIECFRTDRLENLVSLCQPKIGRFISCESCPESQSWKLSLPLVVNALTRCCGLGFCIDVSSNAFGTCLNCHKNKSVGLVFHKCLLFAATDVTDLVCHDVVPV